MKAIFIILALMVGPKLCPANDRNLGLSQTAATDNVDTHAAVMYGKSADGRLRQIAVGTDGGMIESSESTSSVNISQIGGATATTWSANTLAGKVPVVLSVGNSGAPLPAVIITNGNASASGTNLLATYAQVAGYNGTSMTAIRSTLGADGNPALNVYLTGQAGLTSITNVAATWLTQTVSTYNLSSTAGLAGPFQFGLTAGTGGAACRYMIHPTLASAPTADTLALGGRYLATTTTVQVDGKFADGTHLSIISVGETAVTGTLELFK